MSLACLWFFIGTVLATGHEYIINIYVILGRRNLFKMGAVRSARDQWRSQPDIWSCKCKFFCVYRPYKEPTSKEMNKYNHLNLHLHDQVWACFASRDSCCVGLAARNFGNGRVVLCTWEIIIASSVLQLLWEGYVFWGFFCVDPV